MILLIVRKCVLTKTILFIAFYNYGFGGISTQMISSYEYNRGLVYSIQRYSIHDGPGIRTLIFFKGCQLECPWCSNPESQNPFKEIAFSKNKCKGCSKCVQVCPLDAIDLQASKRINREKCNLCGLCVRYCPNEAYTIFGQWMTVDKLISEAKKDTPFYIKSGGGVTVSGGEPTLQYDFVREFLKECKKNGINTAIESHGYAEWRVFESLAPYVDLFQIDIKHMNSDLHNKIIGIPNQQILNNIKGIAFETGGKIAIRIPIIPGFNDTSENMSAIAGFAQQINSSGNLTMLHILPYHAMGKSKYESLGRIYSMPDTRPPDIDSIKEFIKIFERCGLPVQEGG